ncbi:MAG: ABC transporter ATP-binding protein [Lachnospiraceae bacterium]|nr:ABC transporter ATP-binding protein [Lachnospiraceae bacterium]
MGLMIKYMSPYKKRITGTLLLKFFAVVFELLIPYILEYMIDVAAPAKNIQIVLLMGAAMIVLAFLARQFNIWGNRVATATARDATRNIRQDLFRKTIYLKSESFDSVSLPSLISEMTSDSYNVQSFLGMIQRLGVRSPIMLIGATTVALSLDVVLALVLICMVPILTLTVIYITKKGIPLFRQVQKKLDQIVRIMRENISGIRVVKGLSREEYEIKRFECASEELTKADIHAGMIMAIPSSLITLFLNVGLAIVVLIGAYRVNQGNMEVGVILAFLTYFNMITFAVMGIRRVFMIYSKAGASADRIASVLALSDESNRYKLEFREGNNETCEDNTQKDDMPALVFDNVSFNYGVNDSGFSVNDISFEIDRGESLGIIGSTGSGKTTILSLIMAFYEAEKGSILMDGTNIRDMSLDEVRKNVGIVLQNDTIFNDTIADNIRFGRDISMEEIKRAAKTAMIDSYIESLPEGYEYMADIKGMNLSGGQRQRILIARALASNPKYLILDDASSALDYATDAKLRKNLSANYPDCCRIVVAGRVSSVKNMTKIIVMEEGNMIGYGTHDELMKTCDVYKEIAYSQMGIGKGGTV